jgi:hypothetical protein
MNPNKQKFQSNPQRLKQEIIHLRCYNTSEALKGGIRELIISYQEKGWALVNIISNKFVIYLQFQRQIFQA